MSLQLIYGRAGSGKSEYCYKSLSEKINDNKIYVITPEQFSFTAEKKLMEAIKTKAVLNAEVITFNRMAYRVMQEVGFANKTNLTKSGKAMLIYDVLNRNKKKLKFLGKNSENIDIVSRSITEFKKHGITVQMLKEELERQENDEYLKYKLQDMILVYEDFQNSIINKYIDENDTLSMLNTYIDEVDFFQDSIIYIDEFSGFTNQEYSIIQKLLKRAKKVYITVCIDSIEESLNPEKDVFYDNKVTVNRLMNLVEKDNIKIEKPIYMEKNYRFDNKELIHLENNIFAVPYKKYNFSNENIEIYLANNQYTEIEYIAKNVLKLVRDKGYRYKDISIITKSIDTYSSLIKAIFSQYNIPVFIDEKKDMSQNLIVKYIISILEIFSKNWSYESVFNYLKIGLSDIDEDEIYKLENYCIKWGITGSKWYKSDWNYGVSEDNKSQIDRFNIMRKSIITPLMNLKNKVSQNKTARELTKLLYEFLINLNIDEKIKLKIEFLEEIGLIELANEYKSSFKNIIDVFDEIVLVFNDEKTTFEKYTDILKIGLKNSELGKIPATQDQVIIGDIDRSRSHDIKALFLIGLNDGMFPSINKNEGFFNDADREKLKENNIELAKGTLEQIYEENFNIYKAFTTARSKIFLSYSSLDSEGKSLRPSIFISKIKRIFPNIIEKTEDLEDRDNILTKETTFDLLIQKINELYEGKEINDIWLHIYKYYINDNLWKDKVNKSLMGLQFTNIPEKLEKKYTDKLYGDVLHTTISRLEQYKSCPFSFYLKYGLNLSEKETFTIKALDTGTFMHDIIDEFFNVIKNKQLDVKEISDDNLNDIVKMIINDKLNMDKNYILNGTAKFKVLTNRLVKVVSLSIKYIVDGLKNTDFRVIGNEVEFKTGKEYSPIKIELDDGKRIEITGKIDRIDLGKTIDGKYIRIIDYKSSVKNIDLNEVISGIQLQLLTYLDATCANEELLPAGVLYFNLIDPIIKANKPLTDEQIEQEIKKKFKMNGLILADINIVKMMDKKLEKGSSDVIPVYLDKDGNISNSKSSVISREQFDLLQKYVKKMIKEISKELYNGNIDLKPYFNIKTKKKPCDYCEYKSVCQFDTNLCGNKYQYIGNMDKSLILDIIKKTK